MKKNKIFNIAKWVKPEKNIVLELDDEVEYIINDNAILEIKSGKDIITLIRVIDRSPQPINSKRIKNTLKKEGVIDYIDKV